MFRTLIIVTTCLLTTLISCKKNEPIPVLFAKSDTTIISYTGIPIIQQYLSFSINVDSTNGLIWYFDDGNTEKSSAPAHMYHSTGIYAIRVTDNVGKLLATRKIVIDRTTHKYGLEGIVRKWRCVTYGTNFTNGKVDTTFVGEKYFEIIGINDSLVIPDFRSKLYFSSQSKNTSDSLYIQIGYPIHGFAGLTYIKATGKITASDTYAGSGGSSTIYYQTID